MRISDWSSDVCSSDLPSPWCLHRSRRSRPPPGAAPAAKAAAACGGRERRGGLRGKARAWRDRVRAGLPGFPTKPAGSLSRLEPPWFQILERRSEEHTSELQSLMRISSAVFCLKKKKKRAKHITN